MLTCTSRFVAVLTRLISAGLHSPNSPKSEAATWDAISETIKTVAELEPPLGAHPNIIRRDVLMSHGYSGQADLVFELIDTLNDKNPFRLGNRVRECDRDEAMKHLALCFDMPTPVSSTPVKHSAPQADPQAGQSTRRWFEQALRRGLLDRLASRLMRAFPREDPSGIKSTVGLSIAKWCSNDMLAGLLASGGTPSEVVLYEFVRRNTVTEFLRRGTDGHCREFHKARTSADLKHRNRYGALSSDQTYVVVQNEDESGNIHTDIADHAVGYASQDSQNDLAEINRMGVDLVSSLIPRGGLRRSEILSAVLSGSDRADLQRAFGISDTRAGHLVTEIRMALKKGPDLIKQTQTIIKFLADEPWSTVSDLCSDSGQTPKEIRKVLAFAQRRGLVKASADKQAYALTLAAQLEG